MLDGVEPVTETLTVPRILGVKITSLKHGTEGTEIPMAVTAVVSNPKATVKVNGVEAVVAS